MHRTEVKLVSGLREDPNIRPRRGEEFQPACVIGQTGIRNIPSPEADLVRPHLAARPRLNGLPLISEHVIRLPRSPITGMSHEPLGFYRFARNLVS